jgi:hypothetical protein
VAVHQYFLDDSHWPLLLIRFEGEHGIVYDTRQARFITSEPRQRQTAW